MKTCRICHVEKTLDSYSVNRHIKSGVNSVCKQCASAKSAEYRLANPEKVRISQSKQNKSEAGKARMKKYIESHPDRVEACRKANYAKNRESILARAKVDAHGLQVKKLYRERNKEKLNARISAWQKANKDKGVARTARYRERNPMAGKISYRKMMAERPEQMNAKLARRRASKFMATVGWANDFFIKEIYALASLRTKVTGIKWHVDHIVPLQSKLVCGLHWEGNMQVITATENIRKKNFYWPDMPEVNHA